MQIAPISKSMQQNCGCRKNKEVVKYVYTEIIPR